MNNAEKFDAETKQSFAWRWPVIDPKRRDGASKVEENIRIENKNKQANETAALEIERELLAAQELFLLKIREMIQEQVERFKKHKHYIALTKEMNRRHENREDLVPYRFHWQALFAPPLFKTFDLAFPDDGFPEGSRFAKRDSLGFASIEQLSSETLNALPEMKALDEVIDAGIGSNHDVAVQLRDADLGEAVDFIKDMEEEEYKGRKIMVLDFTVVCAAPKPKADDGAAN